MDDVQPVGETPATEVPVSSRHSKKLIGGFVVMLIVLACAAYGLYAQKKSGNNFGDTPIYTFHDPNIPFTVHYPNAYCWNQDLGAVTLHSTALSLPCNGNRLIDNTATYAVVIRAFPEFGVATTEEYLKKEEFKNWAPTGTTRMIGGYRAVELEQGGMGGTHSAKRWAFLTNYEFHDDTLRGNLSSNKYGIIIQSALPLDAEGKAAEELILSSFAFLQKGEGNNSQPISRPLNSFENKGVSMEPGMHDGEIWMTDRLVTEVAPYDDGSIARGDIVVFRYPIDVSALLVKRIVGVPGDTFAIHDGNVYLNGEVLAESYVAPGTKTSGTFESQVIPEGQYFVLGDNRDRSSDSRYWGFVPKENIAAKIISGIKN